MLKGSTHRVCAGADIGPLKGGTHSDCHYRQVFGFAILFLALLGVFCRMGFTVLVEFLMLARCWWHVGGNLMFKGI